MVVQTEEVQLIQVVQVVVEQQYKEVHKILMYHQYLILLMEETEVHLFLLVLED